MIVNDDSSIVSKWQVPLIENTRVIIYDRNMFITLATYVSGKKVSRIFAAH